MMTKRHSNQRDLPVRSSSILCLGFGEVQIRLAYRAYEYKFIRQHYHSTALGRNDQLGFSTHSGNLGRCCEMISQGFKANLGRGIDQSDFALRNGGGPLDSHLSIEIARLFLDREDRADLICPSALRT
jgi:hypothetical protein